MAQVSVLPHHQRVDEGVGEPRQDRLSRRFPDLLVELPVQGGVDRLRLDVVGRAHLLTGGGEGVQLLVGRPLGGLLGERRLERLARLQDGEGLIE